MKTAIYIRVSTEEQANEGYSIPAQKRRLKSFCIAQDWDIADFYVDEGISAKNMDRPELKRMINDIEAGKIECVLVYRLDRLTRSVFDLYKLLDIFDRHNCKFKSATEIFDTTTSMGRMFITIVAAMAQWERENLGERVSLGFAEKARQGKYPLNFRPFGYNLDLKESKLSIRSDEAKIVRLIYDLYTKGYGANRICQYLNKRNIRTRDGNEWNDSPLMDILKSPLYIGHIRWNDEIIENTHEPIVDKEKFERVQELIKKRRGSDPRRVSSDYIFSGKLKCPKCGHSLVGYRVYAKLANGERVSYKNYRCLKKKNGICKGIRSISEKNLETAFLDFLVKQDFNEFLEEAATVDIGNDEGRNEGEIEHLQKELEKIEKRKRKWQYAWAEDIMTYEDFKKRMDEANKQEEEIKNQLEQFMTDNDDDEVVFSKETIIAELKNIRKNWEHLEALEKKNLLDEIVQQVHAEHVGKELKITSIDFI